MATYRAQMSLPWLVGASGCGCLLSYVFDLPTGETIVCAFGVALAALGAIRLIR